MSGILTGIWQAEVHTEAGSTDPELRGRTYTIPFETVWQCSVDIVNGGLRGWSLWRANDQTGVIVALARTPILGTEADVRIEVGLDTNGQTRVDATAKSRTGKGHWGRARRLVRRLQKELDQRLGARPDQILDPTRLPEYREQR